MGNTYYLDLTNGDDTGNGLSFAQRQKTVAAISANVQPGDTVMVMESEPAVATTYNATWTDHSAIVSLDQSACFPINGTWVANSEQVVAVAQDNITTKGGAVQFQITYPSSGLMGYAPFASISLSGYQQLSFWVRCSQPVNEGQLSIRLCTDGLGQNALYTFDVPAIPVAFQWTPITIDVGTSMAGSISSIAFYLTEAFGSSFIGQAAVWFDNIVACLPPGANCITHQTLIGQLNSVGAVGDDSVAWFCLARLGTNQLTIDQDPESTTSRGYKGSNYTGPLWKREPILTNFPATVSDDVNLISVDGNSDSTINWLFGANSDGMTSQTGDTWISGRNGTGVGIHLSADFNQLSHVGLVRYAAGLWCDDTHVGTHYIAGAGHCENYGITVSGPSTANAIVCQHLYLCGESGYNDIPEGGRNDLKLAYVRSNNSYGVEISANDYLHDGVIEYNAASGIHTSGAVRVYRYTTNENGGNATAGGLSATYYNGINFDKHPVSRIDPNIDFYWPTSVLNPAPGIINGSFSAIWTGTITATTTEIYTLKILVDDGARLYIDGNLLIDAWKKEAPTYYSTTFAFVAGEAHQFRLEYKNQTDQGIMKLYWSSPSVSEQIVPAAAFGYNPTGSAVWVDYPTSIGYEVNFHDCVFNEANEFGGFGNYGDTRVRSHDHDGVKTSHKMVTDGGVVVNETGADRHTLSGYAWKLMPTPPRSSIYPLDYKLASIAVLPNSPVTVTAFFKRSDGDITGILLVKGGQLDGVPLDMQASCTTYGSYEQLSVTFTPAEIGVIDIHARVFGGSNSIVWVDDMGVTQ